MKTSELTGAALDWAVAKCEGHSEFRLSGKEFGPYHTFADLNLTYSTDWAQGGPIIEQEGITTIYRFVGRIALWTAYNDSMEEPCEQGGPTPLIAAMRCYVASNLGEEVDVPKELQP